jgi:uncharacterized protein (DUF885 family)
VTLSFTNSSLQQLRTRLTELNSHVSASVRKSVMLSKANMLVREDSFDTLEEKDSFPLIALGLKETGHVDLRAGVSDFLEKHYGARAADFQQALASIQSMRDAIERHDRSDDYKLLHFQYYHQLVYAETRFFKDFKNPLLHFAGTTPSTACPLCKSRLPSRRRACCTTQVRCPHSWLPRATSPPLPASTQP